jgi:hypothetical protein
MAENRKSEEEMLRLGRLRAQYTGEYVAWIGDEIVAHGTDLAKVLEEAKKHGDDPVIDKVERSGVLIV